MSDEADNMSSVPSQGFDQGPTQQDAVGAAIQGESSQPSVMGQWAALYASQGLHVFPINVGTKLPHIKNWPNAASCDEAQVAAWWRQWPDANIGWVLGRDGLAAVDCDNKDTEAGGRHEVEVWLAGRGEDLPATLTSVTGSGGHHLIFRLPEDVTMGNRTRVLPDVDIKSADGQIVLPPSVHKTGNLYAWAEGVDYNHLLSAITVMPQSLVNLIGSGKNGDGGKSPISGLPIADVVANMSSGQRDEHLFGLGVKLLKAGNDPDAVLALMEKAARNGNAGDDEKVTPEQYARWKFEAAFKYVLANPPDVLPDWHPERSTAEAVQGASDDDSGRDDLLDGLDTRDFAELQTLERRDRVKAVHRERQARATFVVPPSTFDLSEELDIDDGEVVYTIDGLHEQGSNAILAAQYKAGKTHLMINLFRSLIDGEPYLGELAVRAVDGRIGFINNELGGKGFRRWLREMGIQNRSRGAALNLRGYNLNFETEVGRKFIVQWLRERDVKVLILDTYARAIGGNINDYGDVTRWTDNIDMIKRESGVEDFFLTAHVPHATKAGDVERALGSVRLPGWADQLWFLAMNSTKERFISSFGRAGELDETRMMFDPETHRLTLGERGLGRKKVSEEAKTADLLPSVLSALSVLGDGVSQRDLRASVSGNPAAVAKAIKAAFEAGFVAIEKQGQAHLHTLTDEGRARLNSAVDNIWIPGAI